MRHATVLLVASEAWRGRKGEPLVWDAFTDVSASLFGHRRYENTNHVQLTPYMSTLQIAAGAQCSTAVAEHDAS